MSRAIHLESASSLDTDSFILTSLETFQRGNIRLLRSDNKSSLYWLRSRALIKAWNEMHQEISTFLQQQDGELIKWKRNPPKASHQNSDLYCRRRWWRVQHIANEIWVRWRKLYLYNIQERSKIVVWKRKPSTEWYCSDQRSRLNQNNWKLARMTNIHKSNDGKVRSVDLITSNKTELSRPIHKLVLIEHYKDSPTRKPTTDNILMD